MHFYGTFLICHHCYYYGFDISVISIQSSLCLSKKIQKWLQDQYIATTTGKYYFLKFWGKQTQNL